MGRRAKSQRLKNIAHQNKLKEEDLNVYVDQLLRIGTQPHQNNVLQAMEIQKEIYAITDKIKALEIKTDKHRDYDDQEIINLDSQSVNNRTTAATIASFMNWVSENGAEVKGCEIKVIDGYEMGFVVNQDIPASSLVISVPRNVMLTVEMAMKSDLKELFDHDQILKNMPNVGLAIFLLYEKFKRDSFWRPYIDILPKEYNTIVYFTLEELEELKGSPTLETALKQIKSIARQYGYFYQLFHTSPDPVSRIMRKHFTYNEYCWAVSTVMTRQNTIPSEDGSHMINSLIPLWDMCNHTNGTVSTDYNPELKRCECLSLKDFKPGEQFLIFYGARTNADLFIHNGFVYEDNFHDGYWLKLGISKSDRLQNMRVELLKKLSMSPNSEYFLFRGSKPIDEQTLAFLRVFNMNEEELTHWLSSPDSDDLYLLDCQDLEFNIEKKSWNFLVARIKLFLGLYPTTLEEDQKILKKRKDMNERKKLAIRMRMCEKRILKNTVEYAEKRLEKVEKWYRVSSKN